MKATSLCIQEGACWRHCVNGVLLITTICSSAWRGDSSGGPSYEIGDDKLSNTRTHLVGFQQNPMSY